MQQMFFKRFLHILSYTFLSIALLIVVVCASIPLYLNNKIRNDLQIQVSKQSKGEYLLHMDKLSINIFNQSLCLSGFKLTPVKKINPLAVKYALSSKKINFLDLHLWSLLIHKELIVDKMEMIKPSFIIFRSTSHKKSSTDTTENISIFSMMNKYVRSLCVGSIKICNANLNIYNNLNDAHPTISTKENELNISNFQVNKKVAQQKRWFLADTFQLIINKFSYKTARNLSTLHINKIIASYTDSTLLVDSLQLIPNYNKQQYAQKAGHQTDRIIISVLQATFRQTDIKSLVENNCLIAEKLEVRNFNLTAYRDKNDPSVIKRAKSVQQLLKTIPILTNIEVIQLNNANIVYEEVAKGATKPGIVTFNYINGTIKGFTSDAAFFSKNRLTLHANCLFMNTGKMQAYYSFPLNTNKMVFDCSARLGKMPLETINKILVPNAHLLIKDGMIDSVRLSFHADDDGALGTIAIGYHHLKIALVMEDKKQRFPLRIMSFFARAFIIKKQNPRKNRDMRVAQINYKRSPNRFIFSYTWHSILSGIKPTVGLMNKEKIRK